MDETINLFYKETRDLVNESDISEYTLNFVRNHQPVITPKDVEISRLDGVLLMEDHEVEHTTFLILKSY